MDRYLENQPDAVVLDRFRYLLENLTTLTTEGKVGVDGFDPDGAALWLAFTQTHHEMKLRNLQPPPGFLSEAKTAKPTFPRPAPGRPTPRTHKAQLFKFGQRQFLAYLIESGSIRLSPASAFSDPKLGYAASDDEIRKKLFPPSSKVLIHDAKGEALTGRRLSDLVITFDQGTDYLMWCSSSRFSHRLFDDFSYDACISFQDKTAVLSRLESALRTRFPGWTVASAKIEYLDTHNTLAPSRAAAMWKDHRYTYQREIRVVAIPPSKIARLDPVDLKIDVAGIEMEIVSR